MTERTVYAKIVTKSPVLWQDSRMPEGRLDYTKPALDAGRQFCRLHTGKAGFVHVAILDPKDGRKLWQFSLAGKFFTPAADDPWHKGPLLKVENRDLEHLAGLYGRYIGCNVRVTLCAEKEARR